MNTTTTGTITKVFCPIKGVWCSFFNGTGCSITACCFGNVTWGGNQEPKGEEE